MGEGSWSLSSIPRWVRGGEWCTLSQPAAAAAAARGHNRGRDNTLKLQRLIAPPGHWHTWNKAATHQHGGRRVRRTRKSPTHTRGGRRAPKTRPGFGSPANRWPQWENLITHFTNQVIILKMFTYMWARRAVITKRHSNNNNVKVAGRPAESGHCRRCGYQSVEVKGFPLGFLGIMSPCEVNYSMKSSAVKTMTP